VGGLGLAEQQVAPRLGARIAGELAAGSPEPCRSDGRTAEEDLVLVQPDGDPTRLHPELQLVEQGVRLLAGGSAGIDATEPPLRLSEEVEAVGLLGRVAAGRGVEQLRRS
jgi:hypothetical protein